MHVTVNFCQITHIPINQGSEMKVVIVNQARFRNKRGKQRSFCRDNYPLEPNSRTQTHYQRRVTIHKAIHLHTSGQSHRC